MKKEEIREKENGRCQKRVPAKEPPARKKRFV